MKNRLLKALVFISVLLIIPIGYALAESGGDPDIRLNVNSKKFEFEPGTIRVKQGDLIEVRLTSTDIPHGFGIRAFEVNERVGKGEEKVFRFTASEAGTFPIICTVYCGAGHKNMRGELIVE